ncbi:MAG TPA: hypothetical protein VF316_10305 [Polyangiaceae bacterium]
MSRTLPVVAVLLLLVAACGGRTGLGVHSDADGSPPAVDASRPDATKDGSVPEPTTDASVPDTAAEASPSQDATDGCTAPVVQVYLGSDNLQCKYIVSWSCGASQYQVASGKPGGPGCDPTSDANRGFRGLCTQDGSQIGAFDSADPGGCSCSDTAKLAVLVAKACGFPI